jgi:gliding motility-associated-like protein
VISQSIKRRYTRYLITIFFTCIFLNTVNAQSGLCPPNLDFEFGDFTGWQCRTGSVALVGGRNTITWTGIGQVPGRHTIISAAIGGTDPYGGFPVSCPNGSQFSVMLGNSQTGSQAEGISYTYTIPSTATTFSMIFHYAVVLQNPGHSLEEEPRFRARIIDLSTGLNVPCVDFDFIATSGLPGFEISPINPTVLYKDWTPVSINLSGLAGKTIMLEFITSDCTRGGHFGYAYIDVNTNCNGVISGNFLCPGDTTSSITMTAPFGFQGYEWYSDPTFTQLIGTSQTLTLSPPPTVGSIFPVIVSPYPSFGCRDTLYANITIAPLPIAEAGPDLDICKNQLAQIGSPPLPGYTYFWTPANLVSNPNISNPIAQLPGFTPTQFIVKATDILTGCSAYDSTIVQIRSVDTSIRLTGKNSFCADDPIGAFLSVNNASTGVQWYDNLTQLPGATAVTYTPVTSGNYWAQINQGGCTDSTAKISVSINPIPQASFTSDLDTGCVTKNSFVFTNTSTISDGSAMNYNWKFSDATNQQTTDATKSFTSIGVFTIELVTTSAFGCIDSTQYSVRVMPNAIPNFLWDSICTNRPVQFRNVSTENASPVVSYEWDFKNGDPLALVKTPGPVTFSNPGIVNVSLKVTALGCENDPQAISKPVNINASVPGIRYKDITVPLGSSHYIHVRGDVSNTYSWRPKVQLSKYNDQYTEFFATNDDVKYLIDITDQHTCVTTDTMQMLILKKPGFYLPTAFTPNGDGLNDVAKPYLIGMKSLKSFSVYDRWGNRVFYSEKYGEGWNGKFKGLDQAPGVYIWILVFVNSDDNTITEKGTLTLIR